MVQIVGTVEDLTRSAENMIAGAIAVTTGRLHLDTPDEAFQQVVDGNATALEYFRHELAHQIAMLITRMDSSVTAVYKEHEIPEAEELGSPQLSLTDPVFLVVYSVRETAALRSLIDALDHSVINVLGERCGRIEPGLINVDIIDETRARRVNTGAGGFRPPPTLLVSRGN